MSIVKKAERLIKLFMVNRINFVLYIYCKISDIINYIKILIRFENIQSSVNVKLKEGVCLPKAIMIVPLEDEHLKSVYVESSGTDPKK